MDEVIQTEEEGNMNEEGSDTVAEYGVSSPSLPYDNEEGPVAAAWRGVLLPQLRYFIVFSTGAYLIRYLYGLF